MKGVISLPVKVKRIYEPTSPDDGYRVLVDRLWPRGVAKARADIDVWMKEVAPSDELRRWFGHEPTRWEEFKRKYRQELAQPDHIRYIEELALRARKGTVTLLYAAKDEEHNNAVALKELLDEILARAE